eukprot:SAG11_NODE_10610_length_817_cov_1.111421_1_plen_122_part_10
MTGRPQSMGAQSTGQSCPRHSAEQARAETTAAATAAAVRRQQRRSARRGAQRPTRSPLGVKVQSKERRKWEARSASPPMSTATATTAIEADPLARGREGLTREAYNALQAKARSEGLWNFFL